MSEVIEIHVKGEPPVKSAGGTTDVRKMRKEKRSKAGRELQIAATKALQQKGYEPGIKNPWHFTKAAVYLTINFDRGRCQADAANIIGGIADELQDILYSDDKQLRRITYEESPAKDGQDEYIVKAQGEEVI